MRRALFSLLFLIWASGRCLTASVLSTFSWFIDSSVEGKKKIKL